MENNAAGNELVGGVVQNLLPQFFDNVNDKESRVDVVGMDFIPASLDYSALENLSQMISNEDEGNMGKIADVVPDNQPTVADFNSQDSTNESIEVTPVKRHHGVMEDVEDGASCKVMKTSIKVEKD